MKKPVYDRDGGVLDIMKAKLAEDWAMLTEASINRIAQHHKDGHFGIVTSWQGDDKGYSTDTPVARDTYKGNRKSFNAFRAQVRKDGFGYNRLVGYGQVQPNAKDNSYKEHSLFIAGKGQHGPLTKDHVHNYANIHNQTSYIYSGPETGHVPHVFDSKTGQSLHQFDKFSPGHLGDYHSRLLRGTDKIAYKKGQDKGDNTGSKTKSFALEGEEHPSDNFVWEYVPSRHALGMRVWEDAAKQAALDLGIDLQSTKDRIEEKLKAQFHLYEDEDYLAEEDFREILG